MLSEIIAEEEREYGKMINLHDVLYEILTQVVNKGNIYWIRKILNADYKKIHVAIMVEPYLSYILDGKKTIESRFSKKKVSPFERVERKDIIILKKSGGGIEGVFEAGEVCFFEQLDSQGVLELKKSYNSKICGDEEFWQKKLVSKYATLIEVKSLFLCEQIKVTGKNRQSWLSLDNILTRNKQVIILSGKVESGKTYLSKKIAQYLSCERYSISDYLKDAANKGGYKYISRQILQEIEKEQIELGWELFVKKFMEFVKWNNHENIVVDGVRHVEFFNMLVNQVKSCKVLLVWIEIDSNTMDIRMEKRNESGISLNHVAEENLAQLKERADIVIDNSKMQEDTSEKRLLCELYRCIYAQV